MNTTLSTRPGRTEHQHPPIPGPSGAPRRTARVGLIDRLALHLGVALVKWSRRPRTIETREQRAELVRRALDAEQRDRERQRLMLLLLPPR